MLIMKVRWGLIPNSSSLFFCFPSPNCLCLLQSHSIRSERGKSQKGSCVTNPAGVHNGHSGWSGCLNAKSLSPTVFLWFFGRPPLVIYNHYALGKNDPSLCLSPLTLPRAWLLGVLFHMDATCWGCFILQAVSQAESLITQVWLLSKGPHCVSVWNLPFSCKVLVAYSCLSDRIFLIQNVTNNAVLIYSAKSRLGNQPVPLDFPRHD